MTDLDWSYPNVKNIALKRYNKEFVLDYAISCFGQTDNLEGFYHLMDSHAASLKSAEKKKYFREKYIELLNLKIKMLEILNLMDHKMIQQKYEDVAELRAQYMNCENCLVSFKTDLAKERNEIVNEKYLEFIDMLLLEISEKIIKL